MLLGVFLFLLAHSFFFVCGNIKFSAARRLHDVISRFVSRPTRGSWPSNPVTLDACLDFCLFVKGLAITYISVSLLLTKRHPLLPKKSKVGLIHHSLTRLRLWLLLDECLVACALCAVDTCRQDCPCFPSCHIDFQICASSNWTSCPSVIWLTELVFAKLSLLLPSLLLLYFISFFYADSLDGFKVLTLSHSPNSYFFIILHFLFELCGHIM